MSLIEIRQPGWRDELENTRFPFDDQASLVGAGGEFIPDELFVDASLYLIGADDVPHLSRIDISGGTATFFIGTETTPGMASGAIDILSGAGQIDFADELGRPAGILVCDEVAISFFQAWSQGTHLFEPDQTRFAAACCVPLPDIGVRGFLLDDGSVLSGEVWLVGDNGVVLTPSDEDIIDVDGSVRSVVVIRVDIVGDPLFRRRLCDPVFKTPRFLQSVTFRQGCKEFTCYPDRAGGIRLLVGSRYGSGTVLRVAPSENTLTFSGAGDLMRPS